MMRRLAAVPMVILVGLALAACRAPEAPSPASTGVIPEWTGDYLGQEPPGDTPRLFAPGVVSTGLLDRDIAMLPDGSEIYFGAAAPGYAVSSILVTRRLPDGRWTTPEVASFRLGPANGKAQVSTRIRLLKTQVVIVAAEMSDGSVYMAKGRSKITGGAGGCG